MKKSYLQLFVRRFTTNIKDQKTSRYFYNYKTYKELFIISKWQHETKLYMLGMKFKKLVRKEPKWHEVITLEILFFEMILIFLTFEKKKLLIDKKKLRCGGLWIDGDILQKIIIIFFYNKFVKFDNKIYFLSIFWYGY